MNFLAHIYLSGDNDLVKTGNFIADGIHGKPDQFPPDVQKGIVLHRFIDTYTDSHPIFRQGTKRLHSAYHHYAGVIMDIYYDHFLAKNWNRYHSQSLEDFADGFYKILTSNYEILPEKTRGMMPYMIKHNWLVMYACIEGIGEILRQMDHRTKHRSGMGKSVKELQEFYTEYEQEFTEFFEDMQAQASEKLESLSK